MGYNETPTKGIIMPIYSFGVDSPLKFELTEEYAEAFNRGTQAFFDAQKTHKERTGTEWNPRQPLWIECADEDLAAFNAFNAILQEALERHGRPVHGDELTEDFLVKN